MPKTRLINDDRDAITRAIIAHKFDPVFAALDAEAAALAIEARHIAYGDFLRVMDKAPKGAFHTAGSMRVAVGGKRVSLSFGLLVAHRVFADHEYGDALALPDSDPFGARVMAHAEARKTAAAEKEALSRTTRAMLGNFTTFDDLVEAWPEAQRFVTEQWRARGTYVASVPMIAIASLTAALDLPPEDAQTIGAAQPVAA